MNNLKAEMVRSNVSNFDIQRILGCGERTARSKISGETDFTFPEVLKIRDAYFPGLRLEYLFAIDRENRAAN